MRYHLTLVGMTIVKKSTNSKCWKGCGGKGALLHYWWEYKLVQPLWRTVWKIKNRGLLITSNPTPGHRSGENYNSKRCKHSNVHCSTIYNSQDMEAT